MRALKGASFGTLVWILSFPLFMLISFAVNSLIYPAFLEWFPGITPEYNFVNEREEYEAFYRGLGLISGIFTAVFSSYISVRYNNERMEYMIRETEGMYSLRDGAILYYPRYFKDDIIAALIIPLPIILIDIFLIPALSFLPGGVISLIGFFFLATRAFTDALGAFGGYLVMAVIFFIARAASGIRAIDAYRALWLSEIEYMG